ncbi:28S ribosomal protein S18b; mitochondrial [Camelus dromedarius]|uniref:Small ribosomal subunit protein mS40 n=2 Tax=Camelus TaxID=9836 RepID=A0A5N4CRH0_CAMDR|nr:28S ribosomal protein S18b, mitochondrial [Camelus ferus]XP_031291260.1 28S ribosomal protein S18b, mitochondrial [Camelus dromedarius]KAB1261446.1 28S ribosomal protein S18b; mitochondrial [Camelus dromedarius]
MRSRFSGLFLLCAYVRMAASVLNVFLRRLPSISPFRGAYGVQVPLQTLCTKAPAEDDSLPPVSVSPYKDEPWKYLDSEEYLNRYGSRPVWADYRRNHKGGVPPQRTRKMCIRGNKVAGNPCPICRDQKLHVDFRNVKLLEQFVCAHTGIIFHAPYTGVCMRQHKNLTKAIQKARDYGLLRYHIPQVEPRDLDFSTSHGAVSATPPAPTLVSGDPWYPWYSWKQPPERELSRLRRLYQGHLREASGPPPESMPKVPLTAPAEASSTEQAGPQSAL